MPSDAVLKLMNRAHRIVLKASGGRIGNTGMGMPVLQLTTIGRRSGQARTVMLTSPIVEHGSYVVVGSRGGDDVHPAWYLNILSEPKVEVTIGGTRSPMTARVAAGADPAERWDRVIAAYPHYGGYQTKTERELPLVILEPT